jgi:DNA-directed RNA polymerase, alpha subunit/40 kD subunit
VTSVQIEGVLHEFSSIPGVLEDVTDIILNIKQLALRMHGDGPKRMRLKAKGPGEVTAELIETGHDIEIMNKDLVLCTLDQGATLAMEFTVETGKGYVAATRAGPKMRPSGSSRSMPCSARCARSPTRSTTAVSARRRTMTV